MKISFSQSISLLIGMSIICVGTPASAGLYLELTGLPGYTKKNTYNTELGGSHATSANTNINAESGISYDLRSIIGWSWNRKLLVGFNYNYSNTPLKASGGGVNISDEYYKSQEYGASIGYFFKNFRIIGSYLLGGTMEYKNKEDVSGSPFTDVTMKNKEGSGYQIIIGYDFPIGKHFRLGPSLSWRSISYKKQSREDPLTGTGFAETDLIQKAEFTTLVPMISLSALW